MLSAVGRLPNFHRASPVVGVPSQASEQAKVPLYCGLPLSTFYACLDLPETLAHAYITLRITEMHKPSHHIKVKDQPPWRRNEGKLKNTLSFKGTKCTITNYL
jgi:hypothetical protein